MISERRLRRWRKEALEAKEIAAKHKAEDPWSDRILKMTQELLDQHLLKREK